jgi:hypothetical protein
MPDAKEIREWIQLVFVVIGGTLAFVAFFQNMRQRRLENALKVIGLFKEALKKGDMEHWEELFRSSSELSGAKPGHYVYASSQIPIRNYFSEGSHDGGAIARMAENLEIVCHELTRKTVDARYVWFELGQLMRSMHSWLQCTPGQGEKSLIELYPSIDKAFRIYEKEFKRWPSRVFAYVE